MRKCSSRAILDVISRNAKRSNRTGKLTTGSQVRIKDAPNKRKMVKMREQWGESRVQFQFNFPACAPVHAGGKPSACWSKCRGLLSVRKLFYLKRSAVELYASEAEPGLNAAKTKRAIVTPDLRILGLYDDAAEGMSDFYLSLCLADRQESWESSVARVNSSTERCEYIFHVSRESRLFHLGNSKRCIAGNRVC